MGDGRESKNRPRFVIEQNVIPPRIPVQPGNRDAARAYARHEFGHWVVARALGFDVGEVTLTAHLGHTPGGGSRIDLDHCFADIGEASSFLRNRIQVLHAGCVAQSLVGGQTQQPIYDAARTTNGVDDYAKVRELTRILRGCTVGSKADSYVEAQAQITKIDSDLIAATVAIVEKHAALIEALATNLVGRLAYFGEAVTMSKAEIEAIPGFKNHFP
jgi:hypothetical protein